jgi:hypothetical protein
MKRLVIVAAALVACWAGLVVSASPQNAAPSTIPDPVYVIGYPVSHWSQPVEPVSGHGLVYHQSRDCVSLAGHRIVTVAKAEIEKRPDYFPCPICWPQPTPAWEKALEEWRLSHRDEYLAAKRARETELRLSSPRADESFPGRAFEPSRYTAGGVEVVLEAKVTETNDTWWRVSWKLAARNTTSASKTIAPGTVEFQDRDGFALDQDPVRSFQIGPGGTEIITGFALVRVATAPRIAKAIAKVEVAR